MFSLSCKRKKSVLFLALISLQSFILAESATVSTQSTVQEPTSSPEKTGVKKQKTSLNQEDLTDPQETPSSESENDQLEALLKNVLQQTSHIDSLLQDIALVTSNNQSLSKEQRSAIAKEIRVTRDQLAFLKNQSFTQANPQLIYLVLVINKELCDHLQQALAQGFTSLSPFPLEKHFSRAATEPLLTTEKLAQAIADNELSITKLGRSAETIGLTWYNKLYRSIDSHLFQPWQKHHLTHYSMIVLGATVATAALWWYFTQRGESIEIPDKPSLPVANATNNRIVSAALQNPLSGENINANLTVSTIMNNAPKSASTKIVTGTKAEQFLREFMGPKPRYLQIPTQGGYEQTLINRNQLKFAGLIQHYWKEIAGCYGAFQFYVLPKIQHDYDDATDSLHKKIVELHYNLKGGVFKNRTIKTSVEDFFKTPTCTFDDLIGAEEAKATLSNLADYLINPENFDLAKLTPEKCLLLTGPSRTGKSYTAEAFAGEVRKRMAAAGKNPESIRFLSADPNLLIKYGVQKYIAIAKEYAPCILFIDEIDLLGLQRGGTNITLSEFLVSLNDLSQLDSDKQVIVFAATNRSENLDTALMQNGRFGPELRFSYPSFMYRKDFFVHKLESIGISTEMLDIDSLVRQTVGRSFNDFNSVIVKALQEAKTQKCSLNQDMLEAAIDTVIFKISPKDDYPLSKSEQLLVATAVAGQTLVQYLLDTGAPVVRATIYPYKPKLEEKHPWDVFLEAEDSKQPELIKYGCVFTVPAYEFLKDSFTSEQLKNTCQCLLAGQCAQKLLLDTTLHNKDTKLALRKSYSIAKELVGKGIDATMLSEQKRDVFADKAYDLLDSLEQETMTFLTAHKEQLKRLAAGLLEFGTLNREAIGIIIEGKVPESLDPAVKTGSITVIQHPAVA